MTNGNIDQEFTNDLMKAVNRELGENVMFNLGAGSAPTIVKRWIPTGSRQLDYIISNRKGGGYPEGRIVEIQGPTGCGKSHLVYEVAKSTQRMGGVVVYVDTENATSVDNLRALGINVKNQFAFAQTSCTEEVLTIIERAISKAREMSADVPVTVIWDSLANSSPRAELEGNMDQNTIGLQARVLGKGMRKITNMIGNQKVLLIIINQQREKVGVVYGDPSTTPGGKAVPYACSVRLKVGNPTQLKKTVEGKERVIGVSIPIKTIKNRMSAPFREVSVEIHFGKGLREEEQVFDEMREWCDRHKDSPCIVNGHKVWVEGTGAWKNFFVSDPRTGEIIKEIKFQKSTYNEKVIANPEVADYINGLFDSVYTMVGDDHQTLAGVNTDDAVEMEAAQNLNAELT